MDKTEIFINKEEALRDFFMSLKITFKNATIYNMEHPAFIKSVENLKNKIDSIFTFLSPISIGFTPYSLYVDEKFWEDENIFQELGRVFHFRKIKTLEIRPGITYDELKRFTSKITLSLKDFLREGGPKEILKIEKIFHINVEELDYSLLLKGEGEEVNDIWAYLLEEAVKEEDPHKLNQVAESFENVIGKFNTEELIANEELQKNFSKFFNYLKQSSEGKYRKCAKKLVKSLVTTKKLTTESKFENLKLLISDLTPEDMASTLWEEIITDDKFDSLSFNIFSKLIEKDRHMEIATSLKDLFQTDDPVNRRPEVEEKIKMLLSRTSGQFISDIYRQTLSSLLKDISFDKKLTFDRDHLSRNYRFVLLNTLNKTTHSEQMVEDLKRILEEWEQITQDRDFEYLQFLLEVLKSKEDTLSSQPVFQKTKTSISEFIENAILDGETSSHLDYFIVNLKESIYDVNTYIENIFSKKKVSTYILRAFFKFFIKYLFYFNANLKRNASDSHLLVQIIDCLKNINMSMSLIILKSIFSVGSSVIKLKVLKAMQNLTYFDEKFLFPILKSKNMLLKGEAMILLMRKDETKKKAFERLFNLQSPYGIRNKTLINHIKVADNKNLIEAKDYLVALSRIKFFWNKKLRVEALKVLEKWDAG